MKVEYGSTSPALVIKAGLDLLHEEGEVFEVRIPGTRGGTTSGYFNDTGKAASFISKENGRVAGIYATLNPIQPPLLARSENKFTYKAHVTTTDSEIVRRRWLPIDFDPIRPVGISSTDGELGAARELAETVQEWLASLGWPEPIAADSGNGVHLLYRIEEPNDEEGKSRVECAIKMLATLFSNDRVNVDPSVSNASRIWKVYGTISAKGSNTSDRPHRVAMIRKLPGKIEVVATDMLDTLARPLREAKSEEYYDEDGIYIGDMAKWLGERGQTVTSGPRPMFGNDGQKWILDRCPFNPAHTEPMVGLIGNRPVFRCLHNSCASYRWREFREKIDPTYLTDGAVRERLEEWIQGQAEEYDGELIQTACRLGRKLAPILKVLKKETRDKRTRTRFVIIETAIRRARAEYRGQTFDAAAASVEKGNIQQLAAYVKQLIERGAFPPCWTVNFDRSEMIGEIGNVNADKHEAYHDVQLKALLHGIPGFLWINTTHCKEVITLIAQERVVNPLKTMLMNQPSWDGVERLSTWLPAYMGTKDTPYTQAVGRKWLISGVARSMEPGCQVDHILILEGEEGIGKSSALRILGRGFHVEYNKGFREGMHKVMVHVVIGKQIVEFSELASLKNALSLEIFNAVTTTRIDSERLSYRMNAANYPRTCIFAGTTNETGDYIRGKGRRFWPVLCGEMGPVNRDALKRDVDQIWAEAYEAYERGENWFGVPEDVVEEERVERRVGGDSDPWHGKIMNALMDEATYSEGTFWVADEYDSGIPTGRRCIRVDTGFTGILGTIMQVETRFQKTTDIQRIRAILKGIGFEKTQVRRGSGQRLRVYELRESTLVYGEEENISAIWRAMMDANDRARFKKPRNDGIEKDKDTNKKKDEGDNEDGTGQTDESD